MVTTADPSERFARDAAIAFFIGCVTGIIVGGVGSRVAMRVLAVVNGDKAGVVTDAGNVAGEITAGGTIFLLVVGVVPGPSVVSCTQ